MKAAVVEGFNDIQELDIVEAYKMVEVPRQTEQKVGLNEKKQYKKYTH